MQQILVVGTGIMGSEHIEQYRKMNSVRIAGVVEKNKEKALSLGFNDDSIFNDIDEGFLHKQPDVIDICVPTFLHYDAVEKAAAYGKPIICEKPLARNPKEAHDIIDFCKFKNVDLYVGHVVRFFKEYRRAKEVMDSNVLGDIGMARMNRVSPFPNATHDWYADYNHSGGLILDLMIHDLDYLRWCFGEVKRVFAKSMRGRTFTRQDYALVTLRFENGIIAHVNGSWTHEEFNTSFEFAGSKGIINYSSQFNHSLQIGSNSAVKEDTGVSVPESPLKRTPYYEELSHFLECIETSQTPLVTSEDALKAIEIADAANRSIESGQAIKLTN